MCHIAFCYNCEKQLNNGSKFCSECGVKQEVTDNRIVKKCSSCGEELKSLTGICPSCGHEINNKIINKSLKEFIDKVSELENNIDGYSVLENKGWSTWNVGIKLKYAFYFNSISFLLDLETYFFSKCTKIR